MQHKPIIIMAGGTGGHIYPALAVANLLRISGIPLLWLGTTRGLEAKIVPENNIKLVTINISGLRGKGLIRIVTAPFIILIALLQSLMIFRKNKPAAVLGMGGFTSGPGGIAAWLMRIPLCIHEQNAIAGMTNKILSRFASRIMVAFPGTFPGSDKCEVTGNPVRQEILKVSEQKQNYWLRPDPVIRILVMGGSQGAAILNNLVPDVVAGLKNKINLEIYHQSGDKQFQETTNKYNSLGLNCHVVPFITDMADAYTWADLVICRSGAMTVAELAAAGLASILVPYPYAVDNHQTKNAEYLNSHNAAILCQEGELDINKLSEIILKLARDHEYLKEMSKRAHSLGKPDATRHVAEICMEVASYA